MSHVEYLDWIKYAEVEPWGTVADDHRFTLLINTMRGTVGADSVEQDILFPWAKEVYDAAVERIEDEAEQTRRLEADLDRFFERHNGRAEKAIG